METPDQLAAALAQPSAWPADAPEAEWIQTHISHVFVVGERVFKLRKAVRLPFVDFGTREARNADCLREVALNRRLAPSVYFGVAPVLRDEAGVRVGPVGSSLADAEHEHAVVMRTLPAGRDGLSLLRDGRLGPDALEAVADRLARFHASHGLGRPAPWSAEAWFDRIAAPLFASLAALAESGLVPSARLAAIETRAKDRLGQLAPRLEARRVEGRAVDGHGDVHLAHVWLDPHESEPLLIDCIEFDDALRCIDAASEVAFLAMDLRYRGRRDLAEWFLSAYALRSDDYELFPVVDAYAAYRALVRAKVAALAARQESIEPTQRRDAEASVDRHLTLTESLLDAPPAGEVVLLCGTVGAGKSTVAKRMAQAGLGVPIASDRIRKRLAGVPAQARTAAAMDEGIYGREWTERVYRGLYERAAAVVAGGRTAWLDASFATARQRAEARAWAQAQGVPIRLVEARCDPAVARQRLAARALAGRDPSDAGPDFLATSQARYEPPDEWLDAERRVVWTDREGWERELAEPRPRQRSEERA